MPHLACPHSAGQDDDRIAQRETLLQDIAQELGDTRHLTGCPALSPRVMQALRAVPREAFVPETMRPCSYVNMALPIGHAQTISQPFIVALMTELLALQPAHKVLEIGTGSGYQTAVLSHLVRQVDSVEIIEALARQAQNRLAQLNVHNVTVHTGDGHAGWPPQAPYDAIIVTAAAPRIPQALIDQLKPGGHLVIPVGSDAWRQSLQLVCKGQAGQWQVREVLPVVFVPLCSCAAAGPAAVQ